MEEQIARLWQKARAVSGGQPVLRPLVLQVERKVYRTVAAAKVLGREMSLQGIEESEGRQREHPHGFMRSRMCEP